MLRKIFLLFLITTLPAHAGTKLPLKHGNYLKNNCDAYDKYVKTQNYSKDAPNPWDTVWISVVENKLTISPAGDVTQNSELDGFCKIKNLTKKGDTFSGSGKCIAGNQEVFTGIYRFSYKIINHESFISNGQKFIWCADYSWGRN